MARRAVGVSRKRRVARRALVRTLSSPARRGGSLEEALEQFHPLGSRCSAGRDVPLRGEPVDHPWEERRQLGGELLGGDAEALGELADGLAAQPVLYLDGRDGQVFRPAPTHDSAMGPRPWAPNWLTRPESPPDCRFVSMPTTACRSAAWTLPPRRLRNNPRRLLKSPMAPPEGRERSLAREGGIIKRGPSGVREKRPSPILTVL